MKRLGHLKNHFWLLFFSFFATIGCDKLCPKNDIDVQSVFHKIPATESGIDFVNKIQANVETLENVFDFDYFYNGSGVAIVDVNNDGLLDIVFTANQSRNKIYLNKGNLVFQDITKGSGINKGKGWSTGVSFADVNKDGWYDLYISQGGPKPGVSSRNLLYINQQDLTFKESADEYGLADESISSQSAFFDYDKDGDLDCVVMNESMLYGTDPSSFYRILNSNEELNHHSSSHLYKNENGRFVDATEEAGLLSPTFGLGLVVSDINADGWLDIYIANDYYVPDALYINNGNGSFSNRIKDYTDQVSFYGMGVDIADINTDGRQDIFVLDMASTDHYRAKTLMASMDVKAFDLLVGDLGLHYQYMFNSLQLNLGNDRFKNVAQMTQMAKSDWSWAVLMEDFDNNSTTDVFITNGYKKYALNNDIRMRVLKARREYGDEVPIEVKQEIYNELPSGKLPNLMYRNFGDLKFEKTSKEWGMDHPSFSNGAAYADLDNDGDLEIVVNNIDEPAFLYKNMTVEAKGGNFIEIKTIGNNDPSFAKVTVVAGNKKQLKESKSVRGYLSSMDPTLHFGLGEATKIDTIRVEWLSGKRQEWLNVKVNQKIVLDEGQAIAVNNNSLSGEKRILSKIPGTDLAIDYKHNENVFDDFELETLLPYKQSTLGPCVAVGDVNRDNLDDLFIGGAVGQSGCLYIQGINQTFVEITPKSIRADAIHEDLGSIFIDIDNDNDKDLFVVSGGYEFVAGAKEYEDRLYINDGFGNFQKATDSTLSATCLSGKSIVAVDYNKDGLKDLVVGNRIVPGNYPKAPSSVLYQNTGSRLINVTHDVVPDLQYFGMVNDILVTDFDRDGWEDLIVVGEWTRIGLFKNNQGSFVDVSNENGLANKLGWWFSVEETDINNDDLPDYVVGNLGLNSKYQASSDNPLKIYAGDFDDNRTWDIVLSTTYQGKYVPFRGRECSSNQMPFIEKEFPTYDLFAKATLEDVYGENLKSAYQKEANEFRSMIMINKGNGSFDLNPLPIQAQMAPVLDCISNDLNNDGFEDLVLVGSIYNTEVETPRLDAGSGLVLYSDGESGYRDPDFETGLYVDGNVKTVASMKIGGKEHLLFGVNNHELAIFRLER